MRKNILCCLVVILTASVLIGCSSSTLNTNGSSRTDNEHYDRALAALTGETDTDAEDNVRTDSDVGYTSEQGLFASHAASIEQAEQNLPFHRAVIKMLPSGARAPEMGGSGNIHNEPMISAWTVYDIIDENHRWTLSLKQQHFSDEDSAQRWYGFWFRSYSEGAGQSRHVEKFMLGSIEAFVLSRYTLKQLEDLGQPALGGVEQAFENDDETTILIYWVQGSDFFELTATGPPGAVTWNELLTIAESVR